MTLLSCCRNDRDESGGGTCVNADFVQHYEHWVNSPAGRSEVERCKGEGRQHPDMSNVPGRRVNVSGKAGDLLVWDRLTPHGSSINTSDEPRMVLFVGHTPAEAEPGDEHYSPSREEQAEKWRGQWGGLEGGPRVTELGARLAGLEPWPSS